MMKIVLFHPVISNPDDLPFSEGNDVEERTRAKWLKFI